MYYQEPLQLHALIQFHWCKPLYQYNQEVAHGTRILKRFITMGSLQVAMEDIFPKDLPKQETRDLDALMKII
jgi:hypothetical protein